MYIHVAAERRTLSVASALVCAVMFPLAAFSAQNAAAQEVQSGQGACKLGAQVTDRGNRTGVVVEAKGADCRVRHADGSVHYYLAWMLSSAGGGSAGRQAGGEGAQSKKSGPSTGGGTLTVGSYQCWAAGGVAGTLRIVIKSATQYANGNGTAGRYTFDPQTRKIVFDSGPWGGYYGAQFNARQIGISSRPGNYYGTTCELK